MAFSLRAVWCSRVRAESPTSTGPGAGRKAFPAGVLHDPAKGEDAGLVRFC
jgi:hypothetical protein